MSPIPTDLSVTFSRNLPSGGWRPGLWSPPQDDSIEGRVSILGARVRLSRSAAASDRSRRGFGIRMGLVLAALAGGAGAKTSPPIEIRDVKPISVDEPKTTHSESWIAVNPRDPRNLVAASIAFGDPVGIVAYASTDGGQTWVRATSAVGKKVFPGIDPVIAFDRNGNAYLATLPGGVQVWRSSDGGRKWEGPASVPGSKSADRPFIACSERGGAAEVHVVSKGPIRIFGQRAAPWSPDFDLAQFSSSRDLGETFDFPRLLLTDYPKEMLNVTSGMVAPGDGRIVVGLQTFPPQDLLAAPLTARYVTISSEDGGRTFSDPAPIATWHTWGHANEGRSIFGLGFAGLAADPRTPASLHAAWLDLVDGFYRVMSARSSDGGRHWSPAGRVEDAAPRADSSNPAIAVDGNGVVGIVWNDRRGDLTERCYRTFFAASFDGGETFSKNVPVDSRPTCTIPASEADPVKSEFRFKNGGDTQGIVGLPPGGFRLAWIGGAAPGESGIPLSTAAIRISPAK